ncbi:MAG TPA: carbohydrate binding domain-containing protein [Capsulimonadaceae bacterium]|jgi:hypothetical protein
MTKSAFQIAAAILTASFSLLAPSPLRAADAPAEMVTNPGFEGPYTPLAPTRGKGSITGAVANGWNDNSSWADVDIEYAEVKSGVHGGSSAQSVTVKQVRSGGAQMQQFVPLVANHIYIFTMWVKGQSGAQAGMALRQAGPPYKTYGQKTVTCDGEWHKLTVQALPGDTTKDSIMIYPPIGSTLLIDDASLTDVTSSASDAPAKVGNMLPDGSFEAGFGGGWSVRARLGGPSQMNAFEMTDPRAVVDATTAADQKQSVKITLPCGAVATFGSPLVTYNFGRAHTATVWAKSDVEGSGAALTLLGSTDKTSLRLTKEWQQATLTTTLPFGEATRIIVTSTTSRPGTIWIDGASLSEGAMAFTAPSPELVLSVNRPGGIFFDGEPAILGVAAANVPVSATIHLSCLDMYGKLTTLPTAPASAAAIKIAPDPAHPRGMFKVTAQLFAADGKPISQAVQQVFSRLPRPRELKPEQSYFGAHIPLANEFFQLSRAIGSRWCRIHDATWVTKWPTVETAPGKFEFHDEGVDAALKSGLAVLGMFDGGPVWASVTPRARNGYFANYNAVDTPNAEDEWTSYVEKLATRYKGRIDTWEVWNEPWGRQFSPGTPETYGKLLKLAYVAAKAANPAATIIGIDTARSREAFTDPAMKAAGGSSVYDEFSFHDYYASLYGGPKSPAATDAAVYDGFEKLYGKVTPRWVTEEAPMEGVQSLYWPVGSESETRIQYAKAVRFNVTEIGYGVKRLFYYSLHSDPLYGESGLIGLEHDRTIKPVIAAQAVLAALVDGDPCSARTEPVTGVDCYTFTHSPTAKVDVVWSYDGANHAIKVPKGAKLLDAIGNPLPSTDTLAVGNEPIYILR